MKSAKDWKKRREELITLFQKNEYGRNPKLPKSASYEILDLDQKLSREASRQGGKETRFGSHEVRLFNPILLAASLNLC